MTTWRKKEEDFIERQWAELDAEAAEPTADATGLSPHENLVRAAQRGEFEALVRQAQPAEPLAMVTPQEREAELRAAGRWPADGPGARPAPERAPHPEPESSPGTPDSQYVAEHCFWRPRAMHDVLPRPPGRCVDDYDPFAEFDEE